MEMTYGMDITSKEDQFLQAAGEGLDIMNRVAIPGAFLVDMIPIRAWVPKESHVPQTEILL